MSEAFKRLPLLDQFYREYLDDEVSSRFIRNVSRHYTIETIERLLRNGPVVSRRGAALAIGFLGSFRSNQVLGNALLDSDRAVRTLAEHGIRELWFRDGSAAQQNELKAIARLNQNNDFEAAMARANRLILNAPFIGETWNQRGIASFNLERFEDSLRDCDEAIKRNPYHFSAMVGRGHCFLNLGDNFEAIAAFEVAIDVHPGLDSVRTHLHHLKKAL